MLEAFKTLAKNRTTYRIGLLQAKAYRVLKYETSAHLEPHGISTTEWAFLGLLYDTKGMSPTDAAEELAVEAPFVTVMMRKLRKMRLAREEKDPEDSRRKTLMLTPEGESFVVKTEVQMRTAMKPLIDGVSKRALLDYLIVLTQIVKNVQKKK